MLRRSRHDFHQKIYHLKARKRNYKRFSLRLLQKIFRKFNYENVKMLKRLQISIVDRWENKINFRLYIQMPLDEIDS